MLGLGVQNNIALAISIFDCVMKWGGFGFDFWSIISMTSTSRTDYLEQALSSHVSLHYNLVSSSGGDGAVIWVWGILIVFLPGFNTFIISEVMFVNSFCFAAVFFNKNWIQVVFTWLCNSLSNFLCLIHFSAFSEWVGVCTSTDNIQRSRQYACQVC